MRPTAGDLRVAGFWALTRAGYVLLTITWLTLQPGNHHLADAMVHWRQWDANWYLHIATTGYPALPESLNFFPLYPLLIRLLGGSLAAAMAISSAAALMGFIYTSRLAQREFGGEEAGLRAVVVTAAYPAALFLFAPYSESLFLALAVAALYHARCGHWKRAAAFAFLCGLSRVTALALVLPLAYEVFRRSGNRLGRPNLVPFLLVAGAVPAALATYAAYNWSLTGDALYFVHTQQSLWHHAPGPPWHAVALVADRFAHHQFIGLIDVVPWLTVAALALAGIRRMPLSLTLYQFGLLLIAVAAPLPGDQDPVYSAARYLVASIPAFMVAADRLASRPWLFHGLLVGTVLLQAVLCQNFLVGGWFH